MANTIIKEGELRNKQIEKTDKTVAELVKKIYGANKKAQSSNPNFANPMDNLQDNAVKNWLLY